MHKIENGGSVEIKRQEGGIKMIFPQVGQDCDRENWHSKERGEAG